MAQQVNIVLVDDIDGTEIGEGKGETVQFSLDGTAYEIDLTNKNADKFRGLFQDHIAVARKVGKKTGTAGKRSSTTNTKEIRTWAKQNGFPDVPDRGRLPSEVMKAWDSK